LRSSALTQNSLEFPWYITLSFETDGKKIAFLLIVLRLDLKALPYRFREVPTHAKHRDTTTTSNHACMIGVLIVSLQQIVFKQTSCVPWGSAKSPAAKPDVVLFLR
jgi:hypothetical protein